MVMNAKPIGVFDSGLGGLTGVRRLRALLPEEDIVFLGDTGRVPYGNRSIETLISYAKQDLSFLLRFGVKAVLIACGTVSSVAMDQLGDAPVPLCGVVKPAAAKAAALSRSGRVGVIATTAAIQSGAYARALQALRPDCRVTAQACPLLVPLIENGRVQPGDRLLELAVEEYLAPLKAAEVDTLILGCTHYPLIEAVIAKAMGPQVRLVDVAAEAVDSLRAQLADAGQLAARPGGGSLSCWVTDSTDQFSRLASLFISEPGGIRVQRTVIGP